MEKSGLEEQFIQECQREVEAQGGDDALRATTLDWQVKSAKHKYNYHFTWLGRPLIQYPQDMVAMQELLFRIQPELIVETGIAHGGSLIFSASLLELNAMCGGPANARVLGIDIDIREHNKEAIKAHPLYSRIDMIQGSSIDPEVVASVRKAVESAGTVLVVLDSNHTHEHVLAELEAYAPLVTEGSYCVVFDTVIDDLPEEMFTDRPWGPGNNPKTAVFAYLEAHPEFRVDKDIEDALMITSAPDGFLKKVG